MSGYFEVLGSNMYEFGRIALPMGLFVLGAAAVILGPLFLGAVITDREFSKGRYNTANMTGANWVFSAYALLAVAALLLLSPFFTGGK